MSDDPDWQRHKFAQSIEFQPWPWAKRWPLRLFIKPRHVTFTISFYAKHDASVLWGVQAEAQQDD